MPEKEDKWERELREKYASDPAGFVAELAKRVAYLEGRLGYLENLMDRQPELAILRRLDLLLSKA